MKEKMQNILKYGITSDVLKLIAIFAMVIDHVAYYFSFLLLKVAISIMEYGIGRIAMPIFAYLLIQGFFNTKNFKKYLLRVASFGIITQVLITLGWWLNKSIFTEYITNIYTNCNILISFAVTLILLKIIHEPILIKKYDKKQNILFKVIFVILLLNVYIFIPMDYGITLPLLAVLLYAIERFRLTVLISKSNVNISFKGLMYKSVDELTIKRIYCGLIFLALLLCVLYGELHFVALFAIIPIYLYNGERKKKYNKLKLAYYIFFPLHHILLYLFAMVVSTVI